MSIKTKMAAFLTVASSWVGASAISHNSPDDNEDTKNKTEVVKDTINTTHDATTPTLMEAMDSLQQETKNDSTLTETFQDSILNVKNNNLDESRELMLYVIAHFEGMKSRAYKDDLAGIWTINIGNTVRPDGSKVRSGDRITSIEEALEYVNAHVDKNMAADMKTYLPLDKMTKEETAVMGSLLYNYGSGILRNRDRTPSALARAATEYFTTHDEAATQKFEKMFMAHCRVKGVFNKTLEERRKNELTFLRGDVKITVDDNINDDENTINLKKAILGTLYGCKGNPETILSRFSEESRYYCPTDSLEVAMKKELTPTPVKKPVQRKVNPANLKKHRGSR